MNPKLERIKSALRETDSKEAQALLAAIEGMENECAQFEFPEENCSHCHDALNEICDQWPE